MSRHRVCSQGSEWEEAFDEKRNKVYYFNRRTKETKWKKPQEDPSDLE